MLYPTVDNGNLDTLSSQALCAGLVNLRHASRCIRLFGVVAILAVLSLGKVAFLRQVRSQSLLVPDPILLVHSDGPNVLDGG